MTALPHKFQSYTLCAPASWGHPADPAVFIPQVRATVWVEALVLRVRWEVTESLDTFRCECVDDGAPVWQDSCVELFVAALDGSDDYCNFEFNSRGTCLSARGPDRAHRIPLRDAHYARIQREMLPVDTLSGSRQIHWVLEVRIPRGLLGAKDDLRKHNLRGNIYKCGDKTAAPHYLSAFPIETPRPDFHRPEFFGPLFAKTH